ncbi:MAG: DUF2959 domain-containing protein [bacterium]
MREKRITTFLLAAVMLLGLAGCETAYYNAWEKVGVHKRDILVDRIEDTQKAQEDTQEQFRDALEQYRSVVNFDGGDLERQYDKLNGEYEKSEAAANEIASRIKAVKDVAEDLFDEWEDELDQYTDQTLRRSSARQLQDTRNRYAKLVSTMERAETAVHPVLDTLRDRVLYLKHNLNARAIGSLKGELSTIDANVNRLINEMQASIDEANRFIGSLK